VNFGVGATATDKSQRNNCSPVVCTIEDDQDETTGIQRSMEFLLLGGNCVASAYDAKDKGIPDAARCAIEFQYAQVVKQ